MSSGDESKPSSRVGAVVPYILAAFTMAVVLVVVTVSRGGPSDAAKDTLGGKQLKIMAPADPGGGWDSTARAMQSALEGIVGRSEVYNVTGAGGTIGLSQFVNFDGQSNQLMVMGLVMVGAIAANDPKKVRLRPGDADRGAGERGAADRRTQGLADQGRR